MKTVQKNNRRSIRLKGYDYSRAGYYFVTICVKRQFMSKMMKGQFMNCPYKREYLFGEVVDGKMVLNECGKIALNWWKNIENKYERVKLNEYAIMPNHVHGVIQIKNNGGAIHESPVHDIKYRRKMLLSKIIGYFKMNSAKQINIIRKMAKIPVWQRNYHEHIVRDGNDLPREIILNFC